MSNRYPELLKPPDTSESLYSDRNSSYDNVEKRNEREEAGDTRKDQTYDSSEWETPLETDESDVERMKRNKSFKERLDPLLCKCTRLYSLFFFFALEDNRKHLKRDEKIKEQEIEILKIYRREFLKIILFFCIAYTTYLSILFVRYKLGIPQSSIVLLVCIKQRSFRINKVC